MYQLQLHVGLSSGATYGRPTVRPNCTLIPIFGDTFRLARTRSVRSIDSSPVQRRFTTTLHDPSREGVVPFKRALETRDGGKILRTGDLPPFLQKLPHLGNHMEF